MLDSNNTILRRFEVIEFWIEQFKIEKRKLRTRTRSRATSKRGSARGSMMSRSPTAGSRVSFMSDGGDEEGGVEEMAREREREAGEEKKE